VLPASVELVTFAQAEPEVWGVAIDGMLALSGGGTWETVPAQGATESESDWRLASAAGELHVTAAGVPLPHDPTESTDQLCRVQGSLAFGERQVQIDAPGIRALCPAPGAVRADALRAVHAHFDGADGLAVTSLRPRKARGHDHDAISAAILQEDAAVVVGDPRLSTTYADDGSVLRVGLELWLDGDDDSVTYPRRAAGQVADGSVRLSADGLSAEAYAVRWRSRGQNGLGVYLLARPA
jgi:hypothetical protein